MQIKSWKNQKYLLAIISLVSICVIAGMIFFSKDFCFFQDDYFFSTYHKNEKLFDCLLFNWNHGGGYIGYFLSKFISFYIPNLLSIHPCDFTVVNAGIRGIFSIICLLLLSKFLNFFGKYKNIFCAGFVFTSFYFFYSVLNFNTFIIGVNYNYYRYFFSLIFFSLFWHYIFKHLLIKYKKISYLKLIGIIICGYIIGTSSEILFITSILLSIMIFIYGILSKKLYLNRNFYLPILSMFTAAILFCFSVGFIQVASKRGVGTVYITNELLKSFTFEYINIYILKFILYWLLFIILCCCAFFIAKRKHEIQKLVLPVFMEISILLSIYSLIFCGKTFYISGKFWLAHEHIQFLYGMLILYPLYLIISYLIRNTKSKKKIVIKNLFYLILIIGLTNLLLIHNIFSEKYLMYKKMAVFKKNIYIMEKMFRFYELKNEIPKIPFDLETRDINRLKFPKDNMCIIEFNSFNTNFYPNVYKNYNVGDLYCIDKNAVEIFKQNGGNFTNEELSNIKFNRLFNKDFVLNKQSQNNIK